MSEQVLVVEDSLTQAMRLKLVLEREGLKVAVVNTGRGGISMATLLLPAAIVLDVNLPDINGFEVCKALKGHPATARTPVVMLTVKDRAKDTLTGLDAGADDYIPKDDFAEVTLLQTLGDLGILRERLLD